MSDRLALANAIEDAGIERAKAERVASVIVDLVHDSVATKADVQALGGELRADIAASEAAVRSQLQSSEAALRGELRAESSQLRAELKGDAFTFVAPEEEADLRQIERAIGRRLPRVTVPEFDYQARSTERLEVPIAERIAAIRARKSEERARAREKAERRGGSSGPRSTGAVASRNAAAPPRPQPHGRSGQGHVQGPARTGHHRPPQS